MLSTDFPQCTNYWWYGLKHKIINQLIKCSSIPIINIFSLCHIPLHKTSWSGEAQSRREGHYMNPPPLYIQKVTQARTQRIVYISVLVGFFLFFTLLNILNTIINYFENRIEIQWVIYVVQMISILCTSLWKSKSLQSKCY